MATMSDLGMLKLRGLIIDLHVYFHYIKTCRCKFSQKNSADAPPYHTHLCFSFSPGSASPTISPNVSTVTVNLGDRVTFLCSGNSSVKWVGVENATRVKVYTDGTLSISKAFCKDIGIYKCVYVNNTDVEPAFIYLSVRGNQDFW